MISSVIPARLEFSCGHAALVSLPRLKGESAAQRTDRVNSEKSGARGRACDFCGPREQVLAEVRPTQAVASNGARNGHHAVGGQATLTHRTETPTPTMPQPAPATQPLHLVTPAPIPRTPVPVVTLESAAPAAASRRPRRRAAAVEPTPGRRRRRSSGAAGATAQSEAATRPAPVVRRPAAARKRASAVAASQEQRFQIRFTAETIVRASDIRAALRQLESSGVSDVVSIVSTDA